MLKRDFDIFGKTPEPIAVPLVYYDVVHLLKVIPVDAEKPTLLCLLLGEAPDYSDYLCIEISDSRLDAFMTDGIDLRSLFEQPEKREYFLAEGIDSNSSAELEPFGDTIPERWLPGPGYYYSEGYPESDFEVTRLSDGVTLPMEECSNE